MGFVIGVGGGGGGVAMGDDEFFVWSWQRSILCSMAYNRAS